MSGMLGLLSALAVAAASHGEAPAQPRFPSDYQGRWGEGIEGCSAGAIHGGLTIGPSSVRDGEFEATVRSIDRKPDGSLDVSEVWDMADEGPMTYAANYRLSADKKILTIRQLSGSEASETARLVRCGRSKS